MTYEDRPLRFSTADGLNLQGVCWGDGPLQVVFSPGNGFTVECYRPAMDILGESATVFGLNPRGFGGSDRPTANVGWEASLGDLRDFITQTLQPPVILAGHSFGGMLSLWLAAEAPQLVRGLLLLDPSVQRSKEGAAAEEAEQRTLERAARTRTRRPHWPRREAAAKFLRGKDPYAGWEEESFQAFMASALVDHKRGGVALACPPWLEAGIYETSLRGRAWEWAERAQAPTAIVWGESSDTVDPEALPDFSGLLSPSTVISVKGGHTFLQEHPALAAPALDAAIRMLQKCEPDGETSL